MSQSLHICLTTFTCITPNTNTLVAKTQLHLRTLPDQFDHNTPILNRPRYLRLFTFALCICFVNISSAFLTTFLNQRRSFSFLRHIIFSAISSKPLKFWFSELTLMATCTLLANDPKFNRSLSSELFYFSYDC